MKSYYLIILSLTLTIQHNFGHTIEKKAFASFRTRPVMFQGITVWDKTNEL